MNTTAVKKFVKWALIGYALITALVFVVWLVTRWLVPDNVSVSVLAMLYLLLLGWIVLIGFTAIIAIYNWHQARPAKVVGGTPGTQTAGQRGIKPVGVFGCIGFLFVFLLLLTYVVFPAIGAVFFSGNNKVTQTSSVTGDATKDDWHVINVQEVICQRGVWSNAINTSREESASLYVENDWKSLNGSDFRISERTNQRELEYDYIPRAPMVWEKSETSVSVKFLAQNDTVIRVTTWAGSSLPRK